MKKKNTHFYPSVKMSNFLQHIPNKNTNTIQIKLANYINIWYNVKQSHNLPYHKILLGSIFKATYWARYKSFEIKNCLPVIFKLKAFSPSQIHLHKSTLPANTA